MPDDEIIDEEEHGGESYQPTPASGLNKIVKILIYVALGTVGMVLMSVISYYVARYATEVQYKEKSSVVVMKPPPPLESFRFADEFRANTADAGESHFIKLRISLGFEQGQAALSAELAQRTPQLRDMINLILADKTKDELSRVSDQLKLREEIKSSVNHILSDGKIIKVFFEEIIVN